MFAGISSGAAVAGRGEDGGADGRGHDRRRCSPTAAGSTCRRARGPTRSTRSSSAPRASTTGDAIATSTIGRAVDRAARAAGSSRSRPRPCTGSAPTPRTPTRVRAALRGEGPAARPSGDRARRARRAARRRRASTFPTSRARSPARSGRDRSRSSCARRPGVSPTRSTGGRDTVGLRVPDHPLALALLDAFGGGVAAPSANRFGRVSPTTADARARRPRRRRRPRARRRPVPRRRRVDDRRRAPATRRVVLRVGGISEARDRPSSSGRASRAATGGEVAAPGTLAVALRARRPASRSSSSQRSTERARLLAAGRRVGLLALECRPSCRPTRRARPPADVDEYARVLYARLRAADAAGLDVVARGRCRRRRRRRRRGA